MSGEIPQFEIVEIEAPELTEPQANGSGDLDKDPTEVYQERMQALIHELQEARGAEVQLKKIFEVEEIVHADGSKTVMWNGEKKHSDGFEGDSHQQMQEKGFMAYSEYNSGSIYKGTEPTAEGGQIIRYTLIEFDDARPKDDQFDFSPDETSEVSVYSEQNDVPLEIAEQSRGESPLKHEKPWFFEYMMDDQIVPQSTEDSAVSLQENLSRVDNISATREMVQYPNVESFNFDTDQAPFHPEAKSTFEPAQRPGTLPIAITTERIAPPREIAFTENVSIYESRESLEIIERPTEDNPAAETTSPREPTTVIPLTETEPIINQEEHIGELLAPEIYVFNEPTPQTEIAESVENKLVPSPEPLVTVVSEQTQVLESKSIGINEQPDIKISVMSAEIMHLPVVEKPSVIEVLSTTQQEIVGQFLGNPSLREFFAAAPAIRQQAETTSPREPTTVIPLTETEPIINQEEHIGELLAPEIYVFNEPTPQTEIAESVENKLVPSPEPLVTVVSEQTQVLESKSIGINEQPDIKISVMSAEIMHLPVVEKPSVIEVLSTTQQEIVGQFLGNPSLREFFAAAPAIRQQFEDFIAADGEQAEVVLVGERAPDGRILDATVLKKVEAAPPDHQVAEIAYEFRATPEPQQQLSAPAIRQKFEEYEWAVPTDAKIQSLDVVIDAKRFTELRATRTEQEMVRSDRQESIVLEHDIDRVIKSASAGPVEDHAEAERAGLAAKGSESEAEVKVRRRAGAATPGPKQTLPEAEEPGLIMRLELESSRPWPGASAYSNDDSEDVAAPPTGVVKAEASEKTLAL